MFRTDTTLNSGLLRRSTLVSPRTNHRRDRRLPPSNTTGRRQIRAYPTRDPLAVHLPDHQHPVVRVGGYKVSRQDQRARQVHQQVDGHLEGPDAAADTDRGRDRHEGAAARPATSQSGGGRRRTGGRAALLRRHDAVVACRWVLSGCL